MAVPHESTRTWPSKRHVVSELTKHDKLMSRLVDIYCIITIKRKSGKKTNESVFSLFHNLYSVNDNTTFKLNFYYIHTLFIIYNIKKLNIYILLIKFNIFHCL